MPTLDLHPDDADHRTDVICQLIAARTDRKLLQRDIATPLGITAGAVSAFERGRNQTLAGIQAYARACGLRIEVHFDGLPEINSPEADVLNQLAERALAAGDPRRADAWYRAAVMARYATIRNDLDVKCWQIADQAGCSASSISQTERGRDDIRLSTLQRLVRALGGRLRIELIAASAATVSATPNAA